MMQGNSTDRSLLRSKTRLRECVLARRDGISADERVRRSDELCERLIEACRPALRPQVVVAAYFALGSEPDLRSFLQGAYALGCRVCLPCMVRDAAVASPEPAFDSSKAAARARMTFVEIDERTLDAGDAPFLVKPAKALPADDPSFATLRVVRPCEMDVVVVPMVAFDASNNRMGYGGGNYDRFLELLREDALVVGAAFAEQMVDAVPLEPHDKPLPRIEVA